MVLILFSETFSFLDLQQKGRCICNHMFCCIDSRCYIFVHSLFLVLLKGEKKSLIYQIEAVCLIFFFSLFLFFGPRNLAYISAAQGHR